MTRYDTTLDKARAFDQVQTAMTQDSVKTPMQPMPDYDRDYLATIREYVVQAVFAVWNQYKRPAELQEIYDRVNVHIRKLVDSNLWPSDWTWPSKRTVDRRVNECADKRFYSSGRTKIVAVKAGHYLPNPHEWEGHSKTLLEALLGTRQELSEALVK